LCATLRAASVGDRITDFLSERIRRVEVDDTGSQRRPHHANFTKRGGTLGALFKVTLDFDTPLEIELAIRIAMNQRTRGFTGHGDSSLVRNCARRLRARAKRDITVPIGSSAISAISL
jgi:hypothetical protein